MNMYMPAAKDVEAARGPLWEGEPFLAVSVTGTKGMLSFRTGVAGVWHSRLPHPVSHSV